MTVDRMIMLAGAIAGFSGVILAAAGSHMLPGLDNTESFRSWQSANDMHLLHSVLLIALASVYRQSGTRMLLLASVVITAGIIVFSGSIYLSLAASMAGATRFAPLGGSLLILGWLLIAVHAMRPVRK